MDARRLKIMKVYTPDKNEWLTLCKEVPYVTFFHTPLWAEVFERYSSVYHSHAQCMEFNDNVTVMVPLVKKSILGGCFDILLSMPGSTYGGWISKDSLKNIHIETIIKYINAYRNIIWRVNPFDESHFQSDLGKFTEDETLVIKLAGGFDNVYANANNNHHRKIKTARKMGTTVIAAHDWELWHKYYEIYQDSICRWKMKKIHTGVIYDLKFFEEIYRINTSYRNLWLAIVNGIPVAGIICFYWNKHAVVWHGAGLAEYFDYKPNDLVYHHAIEDACTRGYSWFDCNPSNGLDGVSNFKRSLGAEPLRSPFVYKRSLLRKTADLLRKK